MHQLRSACAGRSFVAPVLLLMVLPAPVRPAIPVVLVGTSVLEVVPVAGGFCTGAPELSEGVLPRLSGVVPEPSVEPVRGSVVEVVPEFVVVEGGGFSMGFPELSVVVEPLRLVWA